MSDIRQVRQHAGWYASYMEEEQGRCLIECMDKKIKADDKLLEEILEVIKENKLSEAASKYHVLDSLECLINRRPVVKHKIGYFIWEV